MLEKGELAQAPGEEYHVLADCLSIRVFQKSDLYQTPGQSTASTRTQILDFSHCFQLTYQHLKRDKNSFVWYATECHFPMGRISSKTEILFAFFRLTKLPNNHKSNRKQCGSSSVLEA